MLRDLLMSILSVTQTLGDIKIQAEHFLTNLNDAMTVNVESITHRDNRRNGDYVCDNVQNELRKVNMIYFTFCYLVLIIRRIAYKRR